MISTIGIRENLIKLKCVIAAIGYLALPSVGSAAQVMPTPGFNLGNTLESTWGYAPPTQALINSIADAGFKTLRVPCAWDFNSTNGTINPAYMTEVSNVVDWALARGMYVIINCHWDNGWFDDDFAAYDSNLNSKLLNIWSQVANRFKDYDSERLSFACANEPVVYSQTQNDVLYQYYQNWINAMRATGGGNAVRWLVVQAGSPWDWNILLTYGLNMPTDPAGKLMIEEHTYDPGEFTTTDSDQGRYMRYFWGSGYHVTGTQASRNCTSMEESYLHEQFTRLKTNFVDRGYPVLIGEWAGQPKPTSVTTLTGQYRDQNFRSMTYYNKYMENLISSFGFSGTFFSGQGDPFDPTTGAVSDQDKLNSILGVSALPPLPGLADGTGALQTLLLFNEAGGTTAADSTLSGRHGTLVGGPTRIAGKGGNAVDLDGTDDHVSLPISAVSSLADFTISTWVNLDAASGWSRIFDFGSGTTSNMFLTPANGATGTVRFAITTTGGGGEQQINGTAALPTGVWTHVAVTLSGNLGILYVNGVEVGRNAALTLTPRDLGVTTQNWIGRSQYPDPYLNGRVDDFRIYVNALPASDVLALFNGTAGALAGPWASQDIGSPSLPGNSGSLGDDIYVTASGSDIWGGSDQFHYVSRTWTGDGTLTARVNGVTVTNTWIKAGLMFRESLDANARNALVATLPGNTDITFQSRSSTGGGTAGINIDVPAAPPAGPYWLKLQRVGNVFTPYHSADGTTWTQTASPVTLSLPTTCYVGFAATAHNNTLLTAAQFDHISLGASAPVTPTGLTATAGNAELVLNWSAASDATSYHVKRATVSGGPYTDVANVTTTSYTDTGLASGTTYYYVVAATNGHGVSPDSTEASAMPIMKLTGAIIGSSGSWGTGNTIASVFDGNMTTYYDALNGTGDWAGLDLGSVAAPIVTQVKYCPRTGWASRMVGGQFQGANVADFSSGVTTLFTVTSTPPEGTMTVQAVTNASSFRYLRYIGPANAFCNVAEVEFDGYPAIPSVPTNLVAAPGNASIVLSWSGSAGADSYIVKRSTTSGSGYVTIASGVTATGYSDTGLTIGTTYYYVVSAVNANGESANSAQTSATPQVPAPTIRLAPRSWITTDPLVYPASDASHPVAGIKDPSVVFHDGRWHVFATTAGSNGWGMAYYNFASWDEAPAATPFYLDNNPNLAGYNAAPQVFYFRPQNKWYLIFQSAHPRFSTTTNIADPMSWSAPQNFFAGTPASVVEGWLDYWIICDDTHAYLFFPDDHGRLYRSRTTLANFPNGFDEPVVILHEADPADLFEGSCVYRIKDTNQFLLLVECIGKHRYYRAWVADSLDGVWTPLPGADSEETPFAGDANVRTSDGSLFWSEGVSHGELLREGSDETMTLDPENIRFLYQGFARGSNPPDYVLLPYHLALLESAPALPSLQTLLLFNEASGTTAADSTINARHGTLVGGPTRVTGKGGNAVDLDGTNDHVSLPTGVVSSLIDFTISTWVNLDAASGWSRIFDFGTGTTSNMFLTPANGATGTVRFAITTSGGGGEQQINGTSALPTGVWTHVAVTVAGNLGILYVNGVEVGRNESLTLTAMSLGATTQNWIGRSQYPDPYLDGRVDDFRIYGNALAPSDVLALFNGTAGALAVPWASQDIGSVGLPGSSGSPGLPGNMGSPGDDIYVTASGGDIWGWSDEFHYVSRTWTGDGTLIARVNGVAVADAWTKAGLMFRESLSPNAPNAFLTVTPGTNGINFQTRSSPGGDTASSGVGALAASYWLKLQRTGNVFTPYHSEDGITWTQTAAPVTLSLPTTCYVGFAATAHNNTLLTAAQFDHISLGTSTPATPTGLTVNAGNAQVALSWNAAPGATGYTVQRSASSGGPYSTLATGTPGTSYTDTGLANGATWYYTIAAEGVSGTGIASAPVSATTYTAQESWRFANFGTIANSGNAADSADPDGDGMTNAQEFTAGTDPNSAASVFKISQLQVTGNDIQVSFATVLGKVYRLESSDTLLNGSWVTMQDNIAGTGGTLSITNVGGAALPQRFYRFVVTP